MEWNVYKRIFQTEAKNKGLEKNVINSHVKYAKKLYDNALPIIYDQTHLSLLLGIHNGYLHGMSNAPQKFYRTFYINKRNGSKRRIDEPLPDLKKIQSWILNEILYKMPCSAFAKAYIPNKSIKDNVRFHMGQQIVLVADIKDFFPSIKTDKILNVFLEIGYNVSVAMILTKLSCFRGSLPQGAPTSAYLSNLIMKNFDKTISQYCVENKIRYTRYADDLTFSGSFDIAKMLNIIDWNLKSIKFERNCAKLKIMRSGTRQKVTGVVTNEKLQLPREYRMKIRQDVYYILKFGLNDHLNHNKITNYETLDYLRYMLGKINYAIFINPKDEEMLECFKKISQLYHKEMIENA